MRMRRNKLQQVQRNVLPCAEPHSFPHSFPNSSQSPVGFHHRWYRRSPARANPQLFPILRTDRIARLATGYLPLALPATGYWLLAATFTAVSGISIAPTRSLAGSLASRSAGSIRPWPARRYPAAHSNPLAAPDTCLYPHSRAIRLSPSSPRRRRGPHSLASYTTSPLYFPSGVGANATPLRSAAYHTV